MVNIPSQRGIQEWLVYWKIPLKYQLIGDKHLIMLFGFQPSQIGGAGFSQPQYGGFLMAGGTPLSLDGLFHGKSPSKIWMMTGGSSISGNLHIV